jgi:hypothetical protein
MTKNMGNIDKTLRIIVGIVLISLVFIGPKTAWGWIGLLLLATSFISWCPAYVPFKFSTIGKKKAE